MMVDFNKHTWVHQGNINKVKKLIMEVEKFQRIRIEALEKENKQLSEQIKLQNEINYTLLQENRSIVTDLETDINELVEVIKGLDPTNPILQHLKS